MAGVEIISSKKPNRMLKLKGWIIDPEDIDLL